MVHRILASLSGTQAGGDVQGEISRLKEANGGSSVATFTVACVEVWAVEEVY